MSEELLPCPWCGKQAECREAPSYSENWPVGFRVACCGAGPERPTESEARHAWNEVAGMKLDQARLFSIFQAGPYKLAFQRLIGMEWGDSIGQKIDKYLKGGGQ